MFRSGLAAPRRVVRDGGVPRTTAHGFRAARCLLRLALGRVSSRLLMAARGAEDVSAGMELRWACVDEADRNAGPASAASRGRAYAARPGLHGKGDVRAARRLDGRNRAIRRQRRGQPLRSGHRQAKVRAGRKWLIPLGRRPLTRQDFRLTFARHVPRIEPGRDLPCHALRPESIRTRHRRFRYH
jgi:hypothetical protein